MNIGKVFKDSEGNLFQIVEYHGGFAWLRNERGDLKQIGKEELTLYKEVKTNDQL